MASNERSTIRYALYGHSDGHLRATWRVVFSFAVFLGTLVVASALLGRVSFLEVLLNAGSTLAIFVAVAVLLVLGTRSLTRRSLAEYGLALDRRWWRDAAAGVLAGYCSKNWSPPCCSRSTQVGSSTRSRRASALIQ